MLFQWVVLGFPAIELDSAEETLGVVEAVGRGAVEETGASEL